MKNWEIGEKKRNNRDRSGNLKEGEREKKSDGQKEREIYRQSPVKTSDIKTSK